MQDLAEQLLAEQHFWRRWRAVDALLVMATAEEHNADRGNAISVLRRALSVAADLDGLKETSFYKRRLARIHAMLARLGAGSEHKRAALEWYRGAGGYEREVSALEALTD